MGHSQRTQQNSACLTLTLAALTAILWLVIVVVISSSAFSVEFLLLLQSDARVRSNGIRGCRERISNPRQTSPQSRD